MDRFILLSMCIVFAGLLQTVVNTALVRNGKATTDARMDRWSRGLYPAALVGILAVSFWF